MNKKTIIYLILTAIVSLLVGLAIGAFFNEKKNSDNESSADLNIEGIKEEKIKEGIEIARNRLIKRGHASIVARGYGYRESSKISGIIKEINENNITLKVDPINPLADPNLDERNVKIDKNTKFFKRVEKDQEEYEKEMEEYFKKSKEDSGEGTQSEEIPDIFKKEEISLSDLSKNDRIEVVAKEDIHDQKAINASEIVIQ